MYTYIGNNSYQSMYQTISIINSGEYSVCNEFNFPALDAYPCSIPENPPGVYVSALNVIVTSQNWSKGYREKKIKKPTKWMITAIFGKN